jgi:predicted nucleotidyltransferase
MNIFELHGVPWETDEPVILLTQTGSYSHGTRIPPEADGLDDIDAMGVVLPPRRFILGLHEWGSRGTKEIKQPPLDIVLYDLRKFVGLLLQGNPNVLGTLWTPDDCLLYNSEAGQTLLTMRPHFVGKHVYNAFVGYAHAQLKKMYATEGAFAGYMGDKRKKLVLKYGYDTKNAAHLVRLLEMGIEFLQTGCLQVRRPNADRLIEIKKGLMPLADIRSYAEELFIKAKEAVTVSKLPEEPNRDAVDTLLVDLLARHCANPTSPFTKRRI